MELAKLDVDEEAIDEALRLDEDDDGTYELLALDEAEWLFVDVLVALVLEIAEDARDVELEIITFADEIALRTVGSTQEVFEVVYPVKEFAKT